MDQFHDSPAPGLGPQVTPSPRVPGVTCTPRSTSADPGARRFTHIRIFCKSAAIAVVGLGYVVLHGWAFDIGWLKPLLPDLVTMKANTALGLACAGTSLWLFLLEETRGIRRHVAHLLALIAAVIGAATLSQYLFSADWHIDQLLFKALPDGVATSAPGRMAPTTAMALLAIGLALLLLDLRRAGARRAAQLLSLWAALLALIAIIGHIYGAQAFSTLLLHTQMAIHTAIGIILLSGAVFLARPRDGIAGDLTGTGSGSVMARRFMPAVLCAPLLLGWLRLQGQRAGLYGTEFGLALYATSNIIVFAVLVWLNTRRMNTEYRQRSRAEVALHELNVELEERVTERTRGLEQQATQLSEQAELLDLAEDAVIVQDMRGSILYWNRGAERLYGWPREEALGRLVPELLGSEPLAITDLGDVGRRGEEVIHHTRDGTPLILSSSWALQRDDEGTPARLLTIAHDITHQKSVESDRRLLTERLSLATAVARVGVWEWDIVGNTLTWDTTMYDIYGMAPVHPMLYEHWSDRVFREDLPAVEATLQRVITERGQGSAEFRITMADGSTRNVAAAERAVLDHKGHVSHVIGVNIDITERKAAALALEQTGEERLRFKDDFLSHVSHELLSPLTAIKQFSTMFLSGVVGTLNTEQRTFQEIVLKNIDQLEAMIDDLLAITRLETGKLTVELQNVSVVEAISDAIDTLRVTALTKGVSVMHDLPWDQPQAFADPTRLRQILIILLDNAIKFTPDGGRITISARRLQQDPPFLQFEVSDTGCGISPETAERIFERLYQVSGTFDSSRKGLGLGLFICKELVTRQGGRLWVKEGIPRGATLAFTLPMFRLGNLIAPLLDNGRWPTQSVALIMVDANVSRGWSAVARAAWSREAAELLRRCLMPNLDVLLPRLNSGPHGQRLFVAAFADDNGASVLVARIRGQFERRPDLVPADGTLAISHRMLQPCLQVVGEPADDAVSRMADHLDDAMQSHSIEDGHHEQQENSGRRGRR